MLLFLLFKLIVTDFNEVILKYIKIYLLFIFFFYTFIYKKETTQWKKTELLCLHYTKRIEHSCF